jgi:hypothetical protein
VVSVAGDQWRSIKGRIFNDDELADEQQTGSLDSNNSVTTVVSAAAENSPETSDTRQQFAKTLDSTAQPVKTGGIPVPDYDAIKKEMYDKAYRDAAAKIASERAVGSSSQAVSGETAENATAGSALTRGAEEPATAAATTRTTTATTATTTTSTSATATAAGRQAGLGKGYGKRASMQGNPEAAQEFSNRDKKEGGKRVFIDLGANCGMFRV